MSQRAAYPFKRIDGVYADVKHELETKNESLLDITRTYEYDCTIYPSEGDWHSLWATAGVIGAHLVVYWVSGGAGSRELLLRQVAADTLPREGAEAFSRKFSIAGVRHTERAAVLLRIVSENKIDGDTFGSPTGGILWEKKVDVAVRGTGSLLLVEYAAAPAGKGFSAGPGSFSYNPDRGYELVVYTDHLPPQLLECGAAVHGAIAVLLERVIRDAYERHGQLTTDSDTDERRILESILVAAHAGRKSAKKILEQEAKEDRRDTSCDLSNWCWEVAGSIADQQTKSWLVTAPATEEPGEGN